MPSVLVPLAPGFEELEAITIVDLLRRAEFDVTTAGLADGPVTASRKTVHVPDVTLDSVCERSFDLIALPGGLPGALNLRDSEILGSMLEAQHGRNGWIGAICAAPLVLAARGLLRERRATAFPGVLDEYADQVGEILDSPLVTDRPIVTSRGPGTAMDFALRLIELLEGERARDRVEAGLRRPRHHTTRELPVH